MNSRLVKWGGPACLIGGVIWILIWLAYLQTHGPTMSDFRRTLLSLTWYDYSKFVIIPLVLFLIGLFSIRLREVDRSQRLGRVGFSIAAISFGVLIASMLVFWLVPFGSYDPAYRNTDLAITLSLVSFVTPAFLGLGLILFGIEILRSGTLRRGNAMPLVAGLAALVPYLLWTNVGFVFGAAWIAVGVALVSPDQSAP